MYADDMVLLAESPSALQSMLDILLNYINSCSHFDVFICASRSVHDTS